MGGCRCDRCVEANSRYHREHRFPTGRGDPQFRSLPSAGPWIEKAACSGMSTDWFFPERGDCVSGARAKEVCGRCEVREDCLEWAIEVNVGFGIWGGLTEGERRSLKGRRRRQGVLWGSSAEGRCAETVQVKEAL